ncbi:hypothetical protein [Streptomyces sp. NPDC046161]|uniref:hypothetical protein n=1 Tax=Streptomyces sp. NPDC046161 TaxID=3155132 RepID=UPI0033C3EB8F
MITIADYTLGRLIAQTKPHMAERSDYESLQVLNFDYDGRHLHTWATNRYTIGVSRTAVINADDEPWMATVGRQQVQELQAAVRLLDSRPVYLERTASSLVLSNETGTRIFVDLIDQKKPLDWRNLLLSPLDAKPADARMAMTPKYFAAWKNLPHPVQMWSTGEGRMVLISAPDFLGGQMPVRREGEDASLLRELESWRPVAVQLEAA